MLNNLGLRSANTDQKWCWNDSPILIEGMQTPHSSVSASYLLLVYSFKY